MRRRTALALVFAACAFGCGTRETSGRARVWTLFDLVRLASQGRSVAAGGSIASGLPASSFVTVRTGGDLADGAPPAYDLVIGHGFVDRLPMTYVTTELWANVDVIWAQPLYRPVNADGTILDDPVVREPWVFGVGPDSLFYSPYWQEFGFEVPAGADVIAFRDTRSVLAAAGQTGGLRPLEGRLVSLAPHSVRQPQTWTESIYIDDTAAWDGKGGGRYLDFGGGRFTYDAHLVVREFPLFLFVKRDAAGGLVPVAEWPTVGGTRGLFAAPPSIQPVTGGGSTGGAGGGANTGTGEPIFGGLWRLYTVELPDQAALDADGRVVRDGNCLPGAAAPSGACVALDSQTAVEALGPGAIHRTELLANCPMLQLGDTTYPAHPQPAPLPLPSP